ncbi:MAG: preprotein translocase subunit SecG [Hyphomicrobiaceae bacterium]
MAELLLVVHLLICIAMIVIILLQKSEGGALGIGGGGGGGGFLTGRGTANLLTRATAGLAGGFFVVALALAWLGKQPQTAQSRFTAPAPGQSGSTTPGPAPATGTGGDSGVLDALKGGRGGESLPSIPQSQ